MGLMSKRGEDLTITRKGTDGTTMTIKSPNGSSMALDGILGGMVEGRAPTPVADNQTIRVTPGEYVVNYPAAQKYKGLLERINQEGRHMLAQGGWIDKPKPMGYANGGAIDPGYANYTQNQFLSEADRLNTPGAEAVNPYVMQQPTATPTTGPVEQQPVAPTMQQPMQEQVDPKPLTSPAIEQPPSIMTEGMATDQEVDSAQADAVSTEVLKAGGDEDLAKKAAGLVDGKSSVEAMLGQLDADIDEEKNKRKKARLLMFGLSLLGGESMSNAVRAANATPFFDDANLNELLANRKEIMTAVRDDALKAAGINTGGSGNSSLGSTGWRGSDGNIYFQQGNQFVDSNGKRKPDNVAITGKASTLDEGDLPANVQKTIIELDEQAFKYESNVNRLDGTIASIEKSPGLAGAFGTVQESLNSFFGTQSGTDQWKTEYTKFRNSDAVQNLPPGVASDRDIALVLEGYPTKNWNRDQLISWMRGYKKMLQTTAQYSRAKAQWLEQNRGRLTGFYEHWKSMTGQNNQTNTSTNEQTVDFDFSGV